MPNDKVMLWKGVFVEKINLQLGLQPQGSLTVHRKQYAFMNLP